MAPVEGQSPLAAMLPMVGVVLIFYFLLIAPTRRRQRQHDEMLENLKTGDKIVTTGGIFGTVVAIREDRLRLKIADQVKIDVTRRSIAGLAKAPDTEA